MKEKLEKWARDPQTWGFFVAIAAMAIIALAFFYPDNFEGNSLHQADMTQGMANGQEAKAYYEATGERALWTNSLFSGMPTFQISPSYASNSLFKWIDKLYGLFLPAPSNLLFMMMFGFLILLYCMRVRWWAALIGAVAWGFSSYYVIIIGAGHIWKFITLAYIPPTIGGLILCYRGRYALGGALTALFAMMQLNANHPQMTYYFAFVMFGFAVVCFIDLYKRRKLRQWLIGTAVIALAGVLAVGANLPSLYNTYEYAKETKRSQSELTPLPDASATAPAERPTGGLPKGEIVGWSYGGAEMFSLLVPNVKGGGSAKPIGGQMQPLTMAQVDGAREVPYEAAQALQYFSQYFNDSEGTNGPVYVGAVIFALFLLGCFIVRGPLKWMLLALTVLSALLALGRNLSGLTDFMIYNFPMYNKFRAVESILVIAEFTMPLLAVLALAKMLAPKGHNGYALTEDSDEQPEGEAEPNTKLCLYGAFGACIALCLLFRIAPSVLGSAVTPQDNYYIEQLQPYFNYSTMQMRAVLEHLRYDMVRDDATRSLFLILIAGVALAYYLERKRKDAGNGAARDIAALVVGVLVLFDLYSVDKRYLSHDSFVPAAMVNRGGSIPAELQADAIDQLILQDTDLSYRVMDRPNFGGAARSYRHKMIGGYHAAKLNRYEDLINRRMAAVRGYGYIPELRDDSIAAELAKGNPKEVAELLADYRVLDMLNTRYIITGDKDQPLAYNPYALGNAWLVDELRYVDNADEEMAALGAIDPRHQAVADKKFMQALGNDVVTPQPGDTISLASYAPNRLTYDVDTRDGALGVFSEVYFPWGWKAMIDGEPAQLGRVNYILRAMRIPAGSHQIEMVFDPDSIRATVSVAYACVTLIYLWLLLACFAVAMRKEKK